MNMTSDMPIHVTGQKVNPDIVTPIHGAGCMPVPRTHNYSIVLSDFDIIAPTIHEAGFPVHVKRTRQGHRQNRLRRLVNP